MICSTHSRFGDIPPNSNLGDALLLGWGAEEVAGFGFGQARPVAPASPEPLTYRGEAHLITVAPTGAGKGRGVIIPNLLNYSGPVVVFDPKGENYMTTARRRRDLGHRVIKLDPFGVIDNETDSLNPFDIFKLGNADPETDAQMLAELLSMGNRGSKEPFWDLSGSALHSGVITYVATGKPEADRHLQTALRLLIGEDAVYDLAVVLDTVGKTMNRMAYGEIASFLKMPDLTRGGVLATALAYTKAFQSARVQRVLENSTFPLQAVVDGEPLSIYMIVPPDKLQSHRSLLKLWVGTLFKAITSRRHLPAQRTLFLLDECGQLQNFPFLESMITLCRGYGAQCWTFWQDLAQLRASYPETWRTILNNCAVVQTFGIHNRDMAHQWADYLDHEPDVLRRLKPEDQVVLVQGQGEQIGRRFDYLRDSLFTGQFDPNRFFTRPVRTAAPILRLPAPTEFELHPEDDGATPTR